MVEWVKKSRRKPTGGINNSRNAKSKSLSDKGGLFSKTTIAPAEKKHSQRIRGGSEKLIITKATNILISDKGKSFKAKLLNVIENPANKHFVRQKVITKGAVVLVEIDGKEQKAKITSRPGQTGQVCGVLVK